MATSYPNKVTTSREGPPLRIFVLKSWSIKSPGKPVQLLTVIESTQAGIVICSESWLDPSISSSEFFFHQVFTSFRNDRSGKGCFVFLLVSNKFLNLKSQEREELKACDERQVVWVKIKVHRSKDLYHGSFYRPPDSHNPDYIGYLQKYIE